jgi:hypothetical protein
MSEASFTHKFSKASLTGNMLSIQSPLAATVFAHQIGNRIINQFATKIITLQRDAYAQKCADLFRTIRRSFNAGQGPGATRGGIRRAADFSNTEKLARQPTEIFAPPYLS